MCMTLEWLMITRPGDQEDILLFHWKMLRWQANTRRGKNLFEFIFFFLFSLPPSLLCYFFLLILLAVLSRTGIHRPGRKWPKTVFLLSFFSLRFGFQDEGRRRNWLRWHWTNQILCVFALANCIWSRSLFRKTRGKTSDSISRHLWPSLSFYSSLWASLPAAAGPIRTEKNKKKGDRAYL